MLVLSRRKDESIRIGDDIEITVVEVRGEVVKIGISAPKHISVYRQEVYDAIQKENIAAAKSSKEDLSEVAKALLKRRQAMKKPSETKE